jgi:hypothetical protein
MIASIEAEKEEERRARERIRQKLEADKVIVSLQLTFCLSSIYYWLLNSVRLALDKAS